MEAQVGHSEAQLSGSLLADSATTALSFTAHSSVLGRPPADGSAGDIAGRSEEDRPDTPERAVLDMTQEQPDDKQKEQTGKGKKPCGQGSNSSGGSALCAVETAMESDPASPPAVTHSGEENDGGGSSSRCLSINASVDDYPKETVSAGDDDDGSGSGSGGNAGEGADAAPRPHTSSSDGAGGAPRKRAHSLVSSFCAKEQLNGVGNNDGVDDDAFYVELEDDSDGGRRNGGGAGKLLQILPGMAGLHDELVRVQRLIAETSSGVRALRERVGAFDQLPEEHPHSGGGGLRSQRTGGGSSGIIIVTGNSPLPVHIATNTMSSSQSTITITTPSRSPAMLPQQQPFSGGGGSAPHSHRHYPPPPQGSSPSARNDGLAGTDPNASWRPLATGSAFMEDDLCSSMPSRRSGNAPSLPVSPPLQPRNGQCVLSYTSRHSQHTEGGEGVGGVLHSSRQNRRSARDDDDDERESFLSAMSQPVVVGNCDGQQSSVSPWLGNNAGVARRDECGYSPATAASRQSAESTSARSQPPLFEAFALPRSTGGHYSDDAIAAAATAVAAAPAATAAARSPPPAATVTIASTNSTTSHHNHYRSLSSVASPNYRDPGMVPSFASAGGTSVQLPLLDSELEVLRTEGQRLQAERQRLRDLYQYRGKLLHDADALLRKHATEGERWEPDEGRDACYHCYRAFSATVTRHHCRRCGRLCCGVCSQFFGTKQDTSFGWENSHSGAQNRLRVTIKTEYAARFTKDDHHDPVESRYDTHTYPSSSTAAAGDSAGGGASGRSNYTAATGHDGDDDGDCVAGGGPHTRRPRELNASPAASVAMTVTADLDNAALAAEQQMTIAAGRPRQHAEVRLCGPCYSSCLRARQNDVVRRLRGANRCILDDGFFYYHVLCSEELSSLAMAIRKPGMVRKRVQLLSSAAMERSADVAAAAPQYMKGAITTAVQRAPLVLRTLGSIGAYTMQKTATAARGYLNCPESEAPPSMPALGHFTTTSTNTTLAPGADGDRHGGRMRADEDDDIDSIASSIHDYGREDDPCDGEVATPAGAATDVVLRPSPVDGATAAADEAIDPQYAVSTDGDSEEEEVGDDRDKGESEEQQEHSTTADGGGTEGEREGEGGARPKIAATSKATAAQQLPTTPPDEEEDTSTDTDGADNGDEDAAVGKDVGSLGMLAGLDL